MRLVGQRFGEWASASRTFSAITDLLAVVRREVARFIVHACSSSSCLPAEILSTAATCSPTRRHDQTATGSWRWRALWAYATAAGQRQPLPACVTVQAPFTACSLWHHHNPVLQFAFSGEAPFLRAVYLNTSIALQRKKNIAANVFYAVRLRRPLSTGVPELLFFVFVFVSFLKLFIGLSLSSESPPALELFDLKCYRGSNIAARACFSDA